MLHPDYYVKLQFYRFHSMLHYCQFICGHLYQGGIPQCTWHDNNRLQQRWHPRRRRNSPLATRPALAIEP